MGAELLANRWLNLPRVKKELSTAQIEEKRREILWMLSDQILNDMAQTAGTLNRIRKVKEAIEINPALFRSLYLYKVMSKNLI